MNVREHQQRLLDYTESRLLKDHKLDPRLVKAFIEVPRHAFIGRYRPAGGEPWRTRQEPLHESELGILYQDTPLLIWGESETLSTISQPSFVLFLIDLLQIQSGDNVFELGAGSGWNAALMARLAEPGRVVSYEIIPELADSARQNIERAALKNVDIVAGDGMGVVKSGLRFQRAMFTAGAQDLPRTFFEILDHEARLLFVLERPTQSDLLLVLDFQDGELRSNRIVPCGFVSVTGPQSHREFKERPVSDLTRSLKEVTSSDLSSQLEGWDWSRAEDVLSLHTEYVCLARREALFGWTTRDARSLVVVERGRARFFGDTRAAESLLATLHAWRDSGAPVWRDLELRALPSSQFKGVREGEWALERPHTTFIWRKKI